MKNEHLKFYIFNGISASFNIYFQNVKATKFINTASVINGGHIIKFTNWNIILAERESG